jgi:hypothetical protein
VREDAVGHYDDLLARRDASFGRAQRAAHRRDAPREPGPRNWVPHRYLEVLAQLRDPLAGENLARHEDHRTATVVAQHGLGDERERDERLPGPDLVAEDRAAILVEPRANRGRLWVT